MYKFDRSVFKAYDIRGEFGVNLSESFYRILGLAIHDHLNPKTAIIGFDHRLESKAFAASLAKSLTSKDVISTVVGPISTPQLYYLSSHADCSIMITGSHLSTKHNGAKILKKSLPINSEDIQELADRFEYFEDRPWSFTNPVRLSLYLDSDGDRVETFVDEKIIYPDEIGVILVKELYSQAQPIIVDTRFSRIYEKYLIENGYTIERSEPGHTNIKYAMVAKNADFGFEFSGHFMIKNESGIIVDSGFDIARLLITLGGANAIESRRSNLPKRFSSGEIGLITDTDYAGQARYEETKYGWYLIRGSNTEPKAKLLAEADSIFKLHKLLEIAKEIACLL